MVSVPNNKAWWGAYDWNDAGGEWSRPWGGAEAQWYGSLFPRIHRFLPASDVLEIACGYGRWTHFLRNHCERLTAVDLAENCIDACRERFADDPRLQFVMNNGTDLPGVPDRSIDFAFSFDSLVHVDESTMVSYLSELSRVLKPDGAAFIHHSNLGTYAPRYKRFERVPKLSGALRRLGILEYTHMRDRTVTAAFVADQAGRAGLRCIGQELIPWLTRRTLIDAISVVVPAESPLAGPSRIVSNTKFFREPAYIARLASIYGSSHGELAP